MDDLSHYLRPVSRHAWAGWVLSLLLVVSTVLLALETHRLHALALDQTERLDARARAGRVPPTPKPSRAELETRRHWEALRHERNFSWYPLFAALEHATSTDIALLEFLPDKKARTLTLRGSARTLDALTAYLGVLADAPAFEEVYLSHQKRVQLGTSSVIGFEVRMRIR